MPRIDDNDGRDQPNGVVTCLLAGVTSRSRTYGRLSSRRTSPADHIVYA